MTALRPVLEILLAL